MSINQQQTQLSPKPVRYLIRSLVNCYIHNLYDQSHLKTRINLKNVGPIHHGEPPHAHSADVASGTVERRLRIDVHDIGIDNDDDNDNA